MLRPHEINWNQVYSFCEVARRASLKEAARTLEVSASTLSEQISTLEKDLQRKLFLRQHRRLRLSPEGARLFQYAKQMFEGGQRLIDAVSPVPLGGYPVAVGFVPGSARSLSLDILRDFLRKYRTGNVQFGQFTHEALEQGLVSAAIDFGFSNHPSTRSDVVGRRILESPLRLFVRTERASAGPEELLQELPLLAWKRDARSGREWQDALSEQGLRASRVILAEDATTLFGLCRSGTGVGVFSDAFVRSSGNGLAPVRGTRHLHLGTDRLFALWMRDAGSGEVIRRLNAALGKEPQAAKRGTKGGSS